MDDFTPTQPLTLTRITIDDDENSKRHLAYSIHILTDKGTITIRGDHDGGPWVDHTDLLKERT